MPDPCGRISSGIGLLDASRLGVILALKLAGPRDPTLKGVQERFRVS